MQARPTSLSLPGRVADPIAYDTLILNSIGDAVVLTDPAGIITHWNEGATRLFGWSAEELLGRHYADRYPEPIRARLRAELARRTAGASWDGEFEDYRKDGSRVWINVRVRRISDADGRLSGICAIAHDISDRKRAEEALRESEERLRLALSAAQMGVWAIDLASGRIDWSPEVYTIYGVSAFDGTRAAFEQLIHPADRARAGAAFGQALVRRQHFVSEFRIVRPDGQVRWVTNTGQLHYDAAGNPVSVIGTAYDVTATKMAEHALLGQNQVLEQIATGAALESILAGIVRLVESQLPDTLCSLLLLRDRRLWFGAGQSLPADYNAAINGAAIGPAEGSCGTAAYTGEAVVVNDIAASPLWANYRDLALRHNLRACWSVPIFASGAASDRRVLGTFAVYRRTVGWPAPNPGEVLARAAHLAGVAIERERDLRKLRESEDRFRLLVDGVRDYAIYLTDPAGLVITWNLGAEHTYGYSAGEAVGGPTDRFYTRQDVAEGLPARDLARAAAEGRYEAEGWRVRKDATQFWASSVITALRYADGALRGFVKVVRDQTAHRRLEEQLRQSQKMEAIGQLAGGVAHDFNNLLTVINGYSEILMQDLPHDDTRQEVLAIILDAGEKAARLTGQLLAFSRKAVVEPRVLDLNEVVNEIGKMLRRLIGEDIALVACLSPTIGWIKIDPGQIEQVILNLAVNARDAMPTGGRLTISTTEVTLAEQDGADELTAGAYVQLTVADTGVGMSDEVKARIFEPFFTTKGMGKGTGLGLATVYGIVRQASGRIAVESALGQGAAFHILLPVAQRPAAALPRDWARGIPRGTETILIVEDEAGVRRLARRTLEQQGYTVIEAGSGHEALFSAEAYTGAIDLLIADVVMPGIGGHHLVEAIRARRPGVPALYISGYTDDAVIRHGVAADAFLQKPFTPDGLSRRVRAILDQGKP